jgi:DNA-binding helix-hairpin-helix protein with protein kinase domain
MPEPDPGTPKNAKSALVVLKGNLQAVHGAIGEYGNIYHCGKQKNRIGFILPDLLPQIRPVHEKYYSRQAV